MESFKHLGFTSSRARFLAGLLEENPTSNHQIVLYWAKEYIINTFETSVLFSCKPKEYSNDFISNGKLRTEIFDEENNCGVAGDVEIDVVDVHEEDANTNEIISEYLKQNSSTMEDTKYWFHGTDHESAINIGRHGIDITKGKEGGDFSHKNGFYITSNFSFAKSWSQKMRKNTKAVIVFNVEDDQIFNSYKGLKLSSDEQEKWTKTVKYFRNGQQDPAGKQLR